MTDTPSRRTILKLSAASATTSVFANASAAESGTDTLHETTFGDDLRVVNYRESDVTLSLEVDGPAAFSNSLHVASRGGNNEARIESLPIAGGRYEFLVEAAGEQAASEFSVSPRGRREYEQVTVRVLPDKITVDYAEI
jgi:hypothetical protein